jgi:hypothetical protein
MTYGLRVINDDSELLIDSNYTSPTFVQKLEFSTTPTSTLVDGLNQGFVKITHQTSAITAAGSFIVMWTLPENSGYNDGSTGSNGVYKMTYYRFPTSTVSFGNTIACEVYTTITGDTYTYKLPTAYLFAITNLPDTTGYALRLYNSSGAKSFDSNSLPLVPQAFSDSFTFVYDPTGVLSNLDAQTTITGLPSNPIFMLPHYYEFVVSNDYPSYTSRSSASFAPAYRRMGSIVAAKAICTSIEASVSGAWSGDLYNRNFFNYQAWNYIAGNKYDLSMMAAESTLYATAAAGSATGQAITFTLSASVSPPVNEGTQFTITLQGTNIPNGTTYPWTVTGINSADLSSGGLTGTFVVSNNIATASFTLAADTTTEGTESFVLNVNNTSSSISLNIADTSIGAASNSFTSSPASVDEGSSVNATFSATNMGGKGISFTIESPTSGTAANSADISITSPLSAIWTYLHPGEGYWNVPSNSASNVTVTVAAAADSTTEGIEKFRIAARDASDNSVLAYSSDITINDTSKSPPSYNISATSGTWNENTTQTTSVTINNASGNVYYPTSNNTSVVCQTTSFTVSSNTYTVTLYWDVGAVSADATITLYLRRGSQAGTIDAQTSVTVKNILPAGTAIGSAFCVNTGGLFTLRQVRADGSGGTYNDDTLNSPTCGYVAPTYSLTSSASSVNEGGNFTITFTTNQSGSFPYTITGVTSADINSTSLTGSLSNNGTRIITLAADNFTEGTETFTIALNNGLASVSVTINDTSLNITSVERNTFTGALSSTQGVYNSVTFYHKWGNSYQPSQWSYTGNIPPGMSFVLGSEPFTGYYADYSLQGTATGSGNYTFTVYATGSGGDSAQRTFTYTVNAPTYPAAGTTSGSQYCGTDANVYTLYQDYHNGSGGTTTSVVETNSTSCGYAAPAYTLYGTTTSINNNTSYSSFYVRSTNANGVTITPSLSGTGAARCSVSPTSRTISGNGTVDSYFTITTTLPTATVAEQSVTLSVAGKSFTFTIPAYTVSAASAPTVTSVTLDQTFYQPGEQVIAVINFSGPITADTYLNIRLSASSYGQLYTPGNLVGVAPPGSGNVYGTIELLVGATSASYVSWSNPGDFTVNNGRVYAVTLTAANGGSARQTAVMSPAFVWEAAGGGGQIEQ